MKEDQMAPSKKKKGTRSSKPIPDPEVREKKTRRRFTPQYKLQILKEAETCTRRGEMGALLRREGLYSSNLVRWRRELQKGLSPKKRGKKEQEVDVLVEKIRQLKQENERLKKQLKKANLIIETQKKISELMGLSTSE